MGVGDIITCSNCKADNLIERDCAQLTCEQCEKRICSHCGSHKLKKRCGCGECECCEYSCNFICTECGNGSCGECV